MAHSVHYIWSNCYYYILQAMAIKFETRIQKFIVREPPCYSNESKGQYSETAPYGLRFVNDEIAASTFVTMESGMLEW